MKTYLSRQEIESIEYGSIQEVSEVFIGNASLGIGLGLDYGGVGVNLTLYPQRNIGLFFGLGYALAGPGFNGGLKIRIVSKESSSIVVPFFLAMYGYNAAIVVENAKHYDKLFYGTSFGFGLDFYSQKAKAGVLSIGLLLPIRQPEVDQIYSWLEVVWCRI